MRGYMAMVPDDTKALLKAYDWDDAIPRLLHYALQRIRRNSWKGISGSSQLAQDIVQDAVLKIHTGERSWDPATHPDLFIYLKGVIKSMISHAVLSPQNKRQILESSMSVENETPFLETVSSGLPSPLQNIAAQEAEKDANEFICNLIDYLHDDPPLMKIVECILDDIVKPRDIAQKLNIDINEVYNRQKRLCRAFENFKLTLDKAIKKDTPEGGDRDEQS